jgi:NO-binding membrane sensor protein with MHYT domain
MQEEPATDPDSGSARALDRTPARGEAGAPAQGHVEVPKQSAAAPVLRSVACGTAAFLGVGVVWDLAALVVTTPPWWPAVSYSLVALGAALACAAVLLRTLQRRGRARRETRRSAIELLAIGVVLLAWTLRGDAEVVPDSPLVAAQAVGALVLSAVSLARRAETGRPTSGRL